MDEYGFVLEVLLQRHRNTEAMKTFLTRLLGEYDVPEIIHTDSEKFCYLIGYDSHG